MGIDLYCKFKRPLTADELSAWSGVSEFTDYDLERAQFLFGVWTDLCHQDYITVTSLFDHLSASMQERIIATKIREMQSRNPLTDSQVNWLAKQVWYRYMKDLRDDKVWYWKGQAILEVAGVIWDHCANGPYAFLFNRFFGDYAWEVASIGRRWWVDWIFNIVDDKNKEVYKENTYLSSCGSLDHEQSVHLCRVYVKQLNGLGTFPTELVDIFYWG
jgi:hypothetical protein